MEDLLDSAESNDLVYITEGVVTLSSPVQLQRLNNISIIGHNNLTVICVSGSGLELHYCTDLTIEGITWFRCGMCFNNNLSPMGTITLVGSHTYEM